MNCYCNQCAWNNSPCTRCEHRTKSVDRADMLFACLAEDLENARRARRDGKGMTLRRFCELESAPPMVLSYLERLVNRWHEGDGK